MSISIGRNHFIAVAAVLGVVAVYLLVDWLVVTPEERVRAVIEVVMESASRADVKTILDNIAPDYDDDGIDRETLQGYAEDFFGHCGPTRVRIRRCKVTVEGQIGVADLRIYARVSEPTNWGRQGASSQWRISMVRYGDRWYIDRLSPVSVAMYPISDLKSLMGNVPSSRRRR